jgi:hypothetical protein
METDAEPQPEPKWRDHLDRPSARTEAEREEHYLAWLTKHEHDDEPHRRYLWFRRYRRTKDTTA